MRAIVLFFLFSQMFLTLLFASNALAKEASGDSQKIQIITTIKPITMLAYAIAKNKADIEQLIPDFASVHHYSFKPSDLRKINNANVIFRIDEHLETFLNPAFESLAESTLLISLAEDEEILLLPVPSKEQSKKEHNLGHAHGNTDMHIWTSPQNAIAMAQLITATLSNIDPSNATNYQNNFNTLKEKINRVSAEISQELIAVKNRKYVVFHNSWQYFQKSLGLQKPIIIALHEDITPSVKSIRETLHKIKYIKPSCVFSDPQVTDIRVTTLIEGSNLNTIKIDALASGYAVNEDAYINWLKDMKKRILGCL